MTVKELITHLQNIDPELIVVVDSGSDYGGYFSKIEPPKIIKVSGIDTVLGDFTTDKVGGAKPFRVVKITD